MNPKHRSPTHPGDILRYEFLVPMNMSQVKLAKKSGIPVSRINTMISGKRGVTAKTAWLLSDVFKNSPEFWMNLQVGYDLYKARLKISVAQKKRSSFCYLLPNTNKRQIAKSKKLSAERRNDSASLTFWCVLAYSSEYAFESCS